MTRRNWLAAGLIMGCIVLYFFFAGKDSPHMPSDSKSAGVKGPESGQGATPVAFKDSRQYQEFKAGTAPIDIASLPTHLRVVIGLEKKDDYWARKNAIRQLGARLSQPELYALYAFLTTKLESQNFDAETFNSLKNDVLDILVLQEPLPQDLAAQMVSMFRDESLDDMWREYCVQHFIHYYERKWPAGLSAEQDPERMALESVYWEAAAEMKTRVAGTALIGLEKLSRTHEEIDRRQLAEATARMAFLEEGHSGSKLTAIRLCGQMELKETLPATRQLLATSTNTLLQLAAIASIGDMGTETDVELLGDIFTQMTNRAALREAAQIAISKIRKRSN